MDNIYIHEAERIIFSTRTYNSSDGTPGYKVCSITIHSLNGGRPHISEMTIFCKPDAIVKIEEKQAYV